MMTLKNISHVTGFSVSTVSKALNNRVDVNEETKKIIRDFACKNNYMPNKNAIALRKSKSNIIAVVLPYVNDSFYSCILSNIQKTASKEGYRIMLFQSFDKASIEKECLGEINHGIVDAAIVLTTKEIDKLDTINLNSKPIKYMQILKNQPKKELKDKCMIDFKNLLKTIK